jgi:hypothetical protein
MTPKALFISVRIKTIKQLADKTGLSRQLCHLLWHGRRAAGREAGLAIEQATGLPLGTIFAVLDGPNKKTRKVTTSRS